MALDRERLARTLKGLAEVVGGGLFSSLTPYYQEGIQIPFDPEGAKQLLSEAGAEGLEFEILGQEQSPFNEMAQTAQADLKAVGINATTRIAPVEVFIEDAYNGNPPPMVTYLWDLPYPHGSYFFDGAFTDAAIKAECCNLSLWSDPGFETLIKDAHSSQDADQVVDSTRRWIGRSWARRRRGADDPGRPGGFHVQARQGVFAPTTLDDCVVLQGLLDPGGVIPHASMPPTS